MFAPLISPNRRLLVIDDNAAIHTDFQKIFRAATSQDSEFRRAEAALFDDVAEMADAPAFEIDSAYQGEIGYRMVSEAVASGRPYAVAFVDMRMPPGWDGMKTATKLWEACPDLQIVICTAYSDHSWEEMLKSFGETDRLLLLKKPFDNIEVLQLAHTLTEKWRLRQQAEAKTQFLESRVAERTSELRKLNEELQAEIAERARAEEALRQAQKLEAVGQLAAGIAHDFNNLLSVIRSYSGLLMEDRYLTASSLEAIREVDSAAERAANLTRQLLTFSRRQIIQPEYLDLGEVVGQVGKLLQRVLGETVRMEIESAAKLPYVLADRGMMEQIILNLAVNARDAMAQGGTVKIRSVAVEFSEEEARRTAGSRAGRFASVSVTDNGCGIAPEILPRVFEPFFTTKEVGKGTGLGLATVYGILRQHEGWIDVKSEPGRGSTFTVYLPESSKPAGVLPVEATPIEAGNGQETILVVEDEEALREVAQLVLETHGYRVLLASSGVDALKLWPAYASKVDLLLTDMVMPGGVSGRELSRRLIEEKPELKVIHTSGYSLELSGADGVLDEGLTFLPKPYTTAKLAAIVRHCLDRNLQTVAA
jgi:signal transduction histidine kinase/DNA-binding NarL/FixJ family response regulator